MWLGGWVPHYSLLCSSSKSSRRSCKERTEKLVRSKAKELKGMHAAAGWMGHKYQVEVVGLGQQED